VSVWPRDWRRPGGWQETQDKYRQPSTSQPYAHPPGERRREFERKGMHRCVERSTTRQEDGKEGGWKGGRGRAFVLTSGGTESSGHPPGALPQQAGAKAAEHIVCGGVLGQSVAHKNTTRSPLRLYVVDCIVDDDGGGREGGMDESESGWLVEQGTSVH